MTKTLLHTCCAPCSVSCVEHLRTEGIEPVSYWFNPNIHPYQEYKARRDTLIGYAKQINMELIVQEDYGLREFTCAVAEDIDHRCGTCYEMRLDRAAEFAAENGFDSFTSTLFVSSTSAWPRLPSKRPGNGAFPSSTGTFVRDFAAVSSRPESSDSICKNTVAAFSAKRIATQSRFFAISRSR